ncbi:dihydroflavonol-4-reductase [Deltaproteobacteria bacterium]|nr:dihydroflavonol-4-reductase [Deltaproteobacteria bacterium]
MNRVAITGATGHLGSNLVRACLAEGLAVRVLVHGGDAELAGLDVERIPGDVTRADTLDALVTGVDTVFHLAALISIDGDQGGRVPAINVGGARNMALAARAAGVARFVHVASVHAFKQRPLEVPINEGRERVSGPNALAYDRSKAEGEAAVRAVFADGLNGVVVYPSGVIGPTDPRPSRMGRFFLDLAHRRLPALTPGGFDWVDVRDVVATVLAAARLGRPGEGYIASGRWASVQELARIAESITGIPSPKWTSPMWLARVGAPFMTLGNRLFGVDPLYTSEALDALEANHALHHHKAAAELGHAPRPIEDTVRDLYAEYAASGRMPAGWTLPASPLPVATP